ncbi:MAG TPA: aminopeptidase [Gammaproteobacteria bacterium]|nr:aminopeptidase [Gammaproteobacteria bacterium]
MRWIRRVIAALAVTAVSGCYYLHSMRGQWDVMSRREPIAAVIGDPGTPADLRARLETVLDLREFASRELSLPDNDSYRSYADVGRPFVAWNVFAAPEFSIEPKQWCFPIIGCVTYRGYFDQAKAERFAAKLRADGLDAYVGPVPAYSTLGYFDDPVLNTMLSWDDVFVASLLFHELAHQRLYVKGDAAFSEAFASVVSDAGVRRWLAETGGEDLLAEFEAANAREVEFAALVERGRERLEELYASGLAAGEMRAAKEREFRRMQAEYRRLVETWDGFDAYGPWFDGDLDNAKMVSVATYNELAPGFRALLGPCDYDLPCFYERAEEIGALPLEARHERLRALSGAAE